MTKWGKFILACILSFAPLGLGVFIGMIKHRDLTMISIIMLVICVIYCLIEAVITEIETKAKIKKLEAEISQLKGESK
nr:MAG TPA: cell division protein [Caudoviricetes sp.]